MKKKTKEQTLPKWFKGLLYTNGETVTNKFSGAEAYLTGTELSMYDFHNGYTVYYGNGSAYCNPSADQRLSKRVALVPKK